MWSTGSVADGHFHGDPDSMQWVPKFCDPQLFQEHVWYCDEDDRDDTVIMTVLSC